MFFGCIVLGCHCICWYVFCVCGLNMVSICCFFFNGTSTTEIYTYLHTLSLHDALPISCLPMAMTRACRTTSRSSPMSTMRSSTPRISRTTASSIARRRSEEHTSELQSLMRISYDVFCLKKKKTTLTNQTCNENYHMTILSPNTLQRPRLHNSVTS